jgi:type IV secretory pathway TraG/TraD family ATPase VirD4
MRWSAKATFASSATRRTSTRISPSGPTWNGRAIVNDFKGDTFRRMAEWRRSLEPVYVLSAAAPLQRFDPTAAAQTEDDLRPLAYAACVDPEDRDPFWAQSASRLLLTLMLAI